jgi:hypothetical protein
LKENRRIAVYRERRQGPGRYPFPFRDDRPDPEDRILIAVDRAARERGMGPFQYT